MVKNDSKGTEYAQPSFFTTEKQVLGSSVSKLESGWYGFCLGSQKLRRTCDCSLLLKFDTTTEQQRVAQHKLPLRVNDEPVCSTEFGRVIYCKSDSIVTVVHDLPPCRYHKLYPLDWRWRLILRHASSEEGVVSGTLSDRKKKIVCVTCARPFADVNAAQLHFNDHHKIVSSVWTTPLSVLYEDDAMVVVDKPQGISIQGGEGKTLQRSNLLLALAGPDRKKPIIAHRLDAGTGGVLVMAKSKKTESHLRTSFARHRCKKRYRAVVFGDVQEDTGVVILPISGKHAETKYEVIRRTRSCDPRGKGWITTVDLFPVSGRKHQIRKHLKHIGHPIWGDRRYAWYPKPEADADEEALSEEEKLDILCETTISENPHARMCLWAMEITIPHPIKEAPTRVVLAAEPPWIGQLIEHERRLFHASPQTEP